MQISGASQSQPLYQQLQAPKVASSEEASEVASGPAEEARESASIAKSAEQSRGMGTTIDVLA
jgi:hypothetical protein